MNVASKVSDLKEKIPDLENQMRKVTHKEHESTKREALFINEEPMRLDDCLERCKALTGTLQTLKEGFLNHSLQTIYPFQVRLLVRLGLYLARPEMRTVRVYFIMDTC